MVTENGERQLSWLHVLVTLGKLIKGGRNETDNNNCLYFLNAWQIVGSADMPSNYPSQ